MALVDASAAVISYMNLFVPEFQRTGENGRLLLRLLAISSIDDFPVGGADYKIITDRIMDIFQSIPFMDRSKALKSMGRAGTYGSIFTDTAEQTAVFKVIDLPFDDRSRFSRMHAFLKESFIQHLLSVDSEYGKHVPKVLAIYKNTSTGMPTALTIKMEKSNITLKQRIQKKIPAVRFAYLQPILVEIIRLLVKLHDKYHFTHRDLKPDNIMYRAGVLQFIDFGMSCIHFKAFGADYNVINNVYYTSRSKCLIEQDIALLLLKLQLDYGMYFDDAAKQFMANIGMPQFIGLLGELKAAKNAAAGPLGQKAVLFHMASNRNNTLYYKRPAAGPNFKPEYVLSKLGLIIGANPSPIITQPRANRLTLNMAANKTRKNMATLPVATLIQPPVIPKTQIQLNTNTRRQPIKNRGLLVGTQSTPSDYAIIPLRRLGQ